MQKGQVPVAINYGEVSAKAIDPIEKKPLYHFLPGTRFRDYKKGS